MKYKYKESLEALSPYSSESRSDKDETWLKLDWNESTFPLPFNAFLTASGNAL